MKLPVFQNDFISTIHSLKQAISWWLTVSNILYFSLREFVYCNKKKFIWVFGYFEIKLNFYLLFFRKLQKIL